MTDHDHMPPIQRYDAKWLSDRSLQVFVQGQHLFFTWDEALALATAITEALQMKRKK